MIIGVTGHQNLSPSSHPWIAAAIRQRMENSSDLVAVTSLARGADQLFARVALGLGGKVECVLPFPAYAETFDNPSDLSEFNRLLSKCSNVVTLVFNQSKEHSYLVAGHYIVERSDAMIAVWNGKPAVGVGGTADIVAYAVANGKPVYHINPDIQSCSEL